MRGAPSPRWLSDSQAHLPYRRRASRPTATFTGSIGHHPGEGTPSRAVVVPASRQAQRRPQALARARLASSLARAGTVREAAPPASGGRAEAEAAAATLRAHQSASHRVAGMVEERPKAGPGRPSLQQPRVVTARRDGLQGTRHAPAEVSARQRQAPGCVVRLTHGPPAGAMAQNARGAAGRQSAARGGAARRLFASPCHGHPAVPADAGAPGSLGGIVWWALRLGRRVERALRVPVVTTGPTVPGGPSKRRRSRPPA
jgi:hypothetical protein